MKFKPYRSKPQNIKYGNQVNHMRLQMVGGQNGASGLLVMWHAVMEFKHEVDSVLTRHQLMVDTNVPEIKMNS